MNCVLFLLCAPLRGPHVTSRAAAEGLACVRAAQAPTCGLALEEPGPGAQRPLLTGQTCLPAYSRVILLDM